MFTGGYGVLTHGRIGTQEANDEFTDLWRVMRNSIMIIGRRYMKDRLSHSETIERGVNTMLREPVSRQGPLVWVGTEKA